MSAPARVTDARGDSRRGVDNAARTRHVPNLTCADCERFIPAHAPACYWSDTPDEPYCEACVEEDLTEAGREQMDEMSWFEPRECYVCARPMRGRTAKSYRGKHVCSDECRRGVRAVSRRRNRRRTRDEPYSPPCAECGEPITGIVCGSFCEPCWVKDRERDDARRLKVYGRDGPLGMYRGSDRKWPGDDGYDPLVEAVGTVWELKSCPTCGRGMRGLTHCSGPCAIEGENAARRVSRQPTTCATCGETFTPTRADGRYCKPACRQRAYRRRVTATGSPTPRGARSTTANRHGNEGGSTVTAPGSRRAPSAPATTANRHDEDAAS